MRILDQRGESGLSNALGASLESYKQSKLQASSKDNLNPLWLLFCNL